MAESDVTTEDLLARMQFDDFEDADDTVDLLAGSSDVLDAPAKRQLKPYSCKYCGTSDACAVVRCSCGKWFCNSTAKTSGSHIVNHLVRARHKEVALHENSPLGDSVLECYNCGGRNVFLLGFVPSRADSVVVLLCREPCLNSTSSLKENPNWDLTQWQPLIEERSFLPWLVRVPEDEEDARPLAVSMINQLEDLWKSGDVNATADDLTLGKVAIEEDLQAIPLQFEDGAEYRRIFTPILTVEGDCDRQMKEGHIQHNVSLRWDLTISGRRCCYFYFTKEQHESRILQGDELRLTLKDWPEIGHTWEATGNVIKVLQASEEVCWELTSSNGGSKDKPNKGPWDVSKKFSVQYIWKSTGYDRMHSALKSFASDASSISTVLYHLMIGRAVDLAQLTVKFNLPKTYNVPNLPNLNHSQIYAVRKALTSPLCLIQGPPGTGKTLTSATIVYHMAKANQGQVLVCAPSNIAADQLASKIHETGLKVVRVAAKSREDVSSSVDFLTLHDQLRKMNTPEQQELKGLQKLRDEIGELSASDERRLRALRTRVEGTLLDVADVIVTTCVGAGDHRLFRFRFRNVLVDECTQATEPEAIIPLVHGAKHVVLVGDHRQLGPVVVSKKAEKAGFKTSLFERLISLGIRPVRLEVQYRMHPALSEFPSQAFYEGSLQNGVTLESRRVSGLDFPWPKVDMPIFLYNSAGQEEISSSGTSYLNRLEALNIEKIITSFLKAGLHASQIGVITPYEGQRAYLQATLQANKSHGEIEIASVDAFQGREKDFILLSCVRSNRDGGLGFLSDPRRLNVALTRAKYGLVICGNAQTLLKGSKSHTNSIWIRLLSHLRKSGLIVEGSLGNLRQSALALPSRNEEAARAPEAYFDEGRGKRPGARRAASSAVSVTSGWDSDLEISSQRG